MRAAGAANHQFHREKDLCRGRDDAVVSLLDAFEQERHGAAGELDRRLSDSGERWADDGGEVKFVKADERHVFRNAYFSLGEGLKDEGRGAVVERKDRGGRGFGGECVGEPVTYGVEGREIGGELRLEAGDDHLVLVALDALMNGIGVFVIADAGDSTVAVLDEMEGGFFSAGAVFHEDAIGVGAGKRAVEGDDGEAGAL